MKIVQYKIILIMLMGVSFLSLYGADKKAEAVGIAEQNSSKSQSSRTAANQKKDNGGAEVSVALIKELQAAHKLKQDIDNLNDTDRASVFKFINKSLLHDDLDHTNRLMIQRGICQPTYKEQLLMSGNIQHDPCIDVKPHLFNRLLENKLGTTLGSIEEELVQNGVIRRQGNRILMPEKSWQLLQSMRIQPINHFQKPGQIPQANQADAVAEPELPSVPGKESSAQSSGSNLLERYEADLIFVGSQEEEQAKLLAWQSRRAAAEIAMLQQKTIHENQSLKGYLSKPEIMVSIALTLGEPWYKIFIERYGHGFFLAIESALGFGPSKEELEQKQKAMIEIQRIQQRFVQAELGEKELKVNLLEAALTQKEIAVQRDKMLLEAEAINMRLSNQITLLTMKKFEQGKDFKEQQQLTALENLYKKREIAQNRIQELKLAATQIPGIA